MQKVDRLFNYIIPEHYELKLNIQRTDRLFSGSVILKARLISDSDAIRLHGKNLKINGAKVNDNEVSAGIDEPADEIVLKSKQNFEAGHHQIEIAFEGVINDPMHGIYPCYFEDGGQKKELIATQLESHHAREVFPCVDEPESKATFDLTLETETGITVLGNSPQSSQTEENNRLITKFETTPSMSTYLLAFVAGEMQSKSAKTSGGVDVSVWSSPAQNPESLDFALEIAVKTTEFFNEYFGTDYPLAKCDHVALPDFSAGAMENWGLITYREVALLIDDKTSSQTAKEYAAEVIAHEISHQWFGNLVTMKWWDDLWLNESFATLMAYVAVDAIRPEWDMWTNFATNESIGALKRDALPGVQAVKTDISHPDEIGTLFDPAIVYGKGARLINMLRRYIGDDEFKNGLKSYFKVHAYSNTEGKDLWEAFSKSSGKDIVGFMENWLEQSGYPIVIVAQNGDEVVLSQSQFLFSNDKNTGEKIWPVPLISDPPLELDLLESTETKTRTAGQSGFIILNKGGSGHYIVKYENSDHIDSLANKVSTVQIDTVDRLMLLNDSLLQAHAGTESLGRTLQFLNAYANESSEPVWDIIGMVIGEAKRMVEGDEELESKFKKYVRRLINKQYERLGWEVRKGESLGDTKLRATVIGLAIYSEDQAVIDKAKDLFKGSKNIASLPAEYRSSILTAVVRFGTQEQFDDLKNTYKSSTNSEFQRDIRYGLTSTKNPVQFMELISLIKDQSYVRLQDVIYWYVQLLRNRLSREDTWQWLTSNWDWIEQKFKNDKSYDDFPSVTGMILGTDEWLKKYIEFFEPMNSNIALSRAIELGIKDIDSRAKWRERDLTAVREFLMSVSEEERLTVPKP